MSVDPDDDCTFYFTSEYIQTTGGTTWRTRVGRFTIPTCGPPPIRHHLRLRLLRRAPATASASNG